MQSIKRLFIFLICFGIIVQTSLSLSYCEIERKYCKNEKSHVACNNRISARSVINDTSSGSSNSKVISAPHFFDGIIFNLSENSAFSIIKNINKFRNALASGKIKSIPTSAARMRIMEWSPEFENLAKLSIQMSQTGDEVGCTATEEFPETREIVYKINYFPYSDLNTADVRDIFTQITKQFENRNKNSIPFGDQDAQKLGCAFAKDKKEKLIVRCIINGHNPPTKELYIQGKPCSQCQEIDAFCDSVHTSLCTTGLTRVRRAINSTTSHLKPNTTPKDSDDYEEDEEDLATYDEARYKDYGQSCKSTEECLWPLICEEVEHMDNTKTKICNCDENYYYHDGVLGTCLLDGYDLIDHMKLIVDEIKVANESVTIPTPKSECPAVVDTSNDLMIMIVTNLVLFIVTWVALIVGCCRLENTIRRRIGDGRQFTSVNSRL